MKNKQQLLGNIWTFLYQETDLNEDTLEHLTNQIVTIVEENERLTDEIVKKSYN